MIRVTVYTRDGCSLCERALDHLESLREEIPHRLVLVDIESEPTLLTKYMEKIPVVQVGPYILEAPFDRRDLAVALAAARDRVHAQGGRQANGLWAARLNRAVLFLAKHWLALFNLMVLLYVGLPFAAPALMKAGATRPASWIYKAYSPLCHQLAFRSWFLFGEQPAYPLATAGTDLTSFSEATGIDASDLWAARAYVGDERLGYKVALCERDVAIYGSMLVAGLIFGLLRRRLKPLPIVLWVLLGIVPIALDGGTQLVSSLRLPFLDFLPARESTPFLRTLTGGLFGVMNVWLAYPYVEETMAETRALLAAKLEEAARREPALPSAP